MLEFIEFVLFLFGRLVLIIVECSITLNDSKMCDWICESISKVLLLLDALCHLKTVNLTFAFLDIYRLLLIILTSGKNGGRIENRYYSYFLYLICLPVF